MPENGSWRQTGIIKVSVVELTNFVGNMGEEVVEELISVIVPVYNAEKYIGECLESIIKQTYKHLQIIIVNDGSTDGSLNICRKYACQDQRITVITQHNQGLVVARKTGVAHATGKYVCFVDSDDWMDAKGINFLYREMIENDADVSILSYTIWDDGKEKPKMLRLAEGVYATEQQWREIYRNCCERDGNYAVLHNVWGKLYKTELYRKAQAYVKNEVTVGEDFVCMYAWLTMAKRLVISNDRMYFYRMTATSMLHRKNHSILCDINRVYNNLLEFRDELGENPDMWNSYMNYLMEWTFRASLRLYGISGSKVYLFPYNKIEKNSKVLLYGAGGIGRGYYKQILLNDYCSIVGVADMDWEKYRNSGLPMIATEDIIKTECDSILISIKDEQAAQEVKQKLLSMGVVEKKIIWNNPQMIDGMFGIYYN